jgi:hypothetical protein
MKEDKLLAHDPLADADVIMREDFYGRAGTPEAAPRRRRAEAAPRPTHYKIICISLYTQDIEDLEAKVGELKRRGWTKANKSLLLRLALSQLDLDKITPPRQ